MSALTFTAEQPTANPQTTLTDEQQEAARQVLCLFASGRRVAALAGSAGTGKTYMTGFFVKHFGSPTVTATTNKAVQVLSAKLQKDWGLSCDVQTVYSAAFKPKLKPEAEPIERWISADIKPTPQQLTDFCARFRVPREKIAQPEARELMMDGQRSTAWSAVGINDYMTLVEGWTPKPYVGGTCIVDEASMLPGEHLDALRRIFDRVLMIGDQKQLQPVKAEPCFHLCPDRVTLKTIHRQAADSPVIKAAAALYEGTMTIDEALPRYPSTMPTQMILSGSAVCIVYRNDTRKAINNKVRAAAGRTGKAVRGDLIVMRSNDGDFVVNQIVKVVDAYRDVLVVQDPLKPSARPVTFIGWDQDSPVETRPRGSVPYRFAYAMTAHTAQGSEWDVVFVHGSDFPARVTEQERRSWSYTATTRAKTTAYVFN